VYAIPRKQSQPDAILQILKPPGCVVGSSNKDCTTLSAPVLRRSSSVSIVIQPKTGQPIKIHRGTLILVEVPKEAKDGIQVQLMLVTAIQESCNSKQPSIQGVHVYDKNMVVQSADALNQPDARQYGLAMLPNEILVSCHKVHNGVLAQDVVRVVDIVWGFDDCLSKNQNRISNEIGENLFELEKKSDMFRVTGSISIEHLPDGTRSNTPMLQVHRLDYLALDYTFPSQNLLSREFLESRKSDLESNLEHLQKVQENNSKSTCLKLILMDVDRLSKEKELLNDALLLHDSHLKFPLAKENESRQVHDKITKLHAYMLLLEARPGDWRVLDIKARHLQAGQCLALAIRERSLATGCDAFTVSKLKVQNLFFAIAKWLRDFAIRKVQISDGQKADNWCSMTSDAASANDLYNVMSKDLIGLCKITFEENARTNSESLQGADAPPFYPTGRHKICMDIQAVLGSQEMQKIFPFPAFHNPIKLKKSLRTNDHKPWAYIVDPQINPEYSRLQGQVIFVWSVQRRVMTVKANPVCEM